MYQSAAGLGNRMLARLTTKLARKLGVTLSEALPADPNPFADWSANLFTAGRRQYTLVSNTRTLYSVVMPGRGVTSPETFLSAMRIHLAECMAYDELGTAFDRLVLPAMDTIDFSKALNRSVTGSMNDLIHLAKFDIVDGLSLTDVSYRLNTAPMSYLGYDNPRTAFRSLIAD